MSQRMQARTNVATEEKITPDEFINRTKPKYPLHRNRCIATATRDYVSIPIAQYVKMVGIAGDIIYHVRCVMATGEIFVRTVSIFTPN